MKLFQKKKETLEYDRETKQPVIKVNICSGEQIGGLKDKQTGKFEEVMLIVNSKDLEHFGEMCSMDVRSIKKEY